MSVVTTDFLERFMQDGATQEVEIGVECPKCGQEIWSGLQLDRKSKSLRKSIVCAYCQNPWIEFLPGQLIAGPFMHPKPKS
jgi:DNA-directed RNA polymerase subunit M/transcription elongation factor TFIIS